MSQRDLRRVLGVFATSASIFSAPLLIGGSAEAAEEPKTAPAAAAPAADVAPGSTKVAQAEGDKIQKVGNGEINWTKKTLKVTGVGAPDLKAPNVAVARLGAERVAKLDALRNSLEVLKGVQVSSGQTVAKSMEATSGLKTKLEGVVKDWKVIDTRYFADGGVEIDVEVSLAGDMQKLLVPDAGGAKAQAEPAAAPDAKKFTGLIIDARGIGLVPALAPKVFDEKGNLVYGPAMVGEDAVKTSGVAGFVASLDAAKADARSGTNPLVIKASKVSPSGKSDVVLPSADAEKVDDLGNVLVAGKVVIVTE